ncbi:hypothetical protein GCM10010389_55880 [Streptomyces echinoruber]|uniref:Uncharacterized protein n=1 Tax=Streptomyces echinoruber TaxID=68898 RepID=A0A918VN15_9ACTN|nr:hypothetical protein GCM10010389_55880 [Streptomyces echinoruber]
MGRSGVVVFHEVVELAGLYAEDEDPPLAAGGGDHGVRGAGLAEVDRGVVAVALAEGSLKLPDGTVHLPEGSALPEGATRLADGRIRLPHDTSAFPEGTPRLPTGEGAPARYLDSQGNLLDEHGNVLHDAGHAPTDIVDRPEPGSTPTAGADTPHTPTPVEQPAMAGAGAHTAEQAAQHLRLRGGRQISRSAGQFL